MSQHAAKLNHIRELLLTRPDQARALCQRIVQSSPQDPWAQSTMARVLLRLGQTQQALHFAQRASSLLPGNPELLMEHAELLGYELQHAKALELLRRALELSPGHAGCTYPLAVTLQNLDRHSEAEQVCREGLARNPTDEGLAAVLAGILLSLGRIEETVALTQSAAAAHPHNPTLASGLALMLNYLPGVAPQEVLAAHTRYADLLNSAVAGSSPATPRRYTNPRDPNRRLRIGLLSPDLRQHSVAYFIEPWLEHYNKDSLELVIYQTNRIADAVTARLKQLVTGADKNSGRWHIMDNVSDAALAEKIHADKVDILIELSGHTHAHSLPALHSRPAPIQATYLGYPNTTGLKEIDYRLIDSITDPPGASDAIATEKLIRLDPCFLCYKPPADTPSPIRNPQSTIRNPITFASFNTVQKLNRSVIACWSRLLSAVPNSRLLLKGGTPQDQGLRDGVTARFAAAGADPARIDFLPRTAGIAEHLALYSRADIALDPFPYNGTTTTCEALYVGVPVITLAGNMHAGRVGASLLTNVGLKDLIADSEDSYIQLAAQLAADPARRAQIRSSLRGMVSASPLCDAPKFAARMESALRSMWRMWCERP